MVDSKKNILIMAGGSGGHIYPALAIAEKFHNRGFNIHWLGSTKGLEIKLIPQYHYPLYIISINRLRGSSIVRWCCMPIMLLLSIWQSLLVAHKIKPVLTLGMGGFVSGPGGIASWLMRIPLIIHEQNAVAGLTNRLLAPIAHKIMLGFPEAFKPSPKLTVTGNPIRESICDIPAPEERFKKRDEYTFRILVLGGSQGAKTINDILPKAMSLLDDPHHSYEIKHQCGTDHFEHTKADYVKMKIQAEVMGFIDDIASCYSWADIVICRSGATTVCELASCGVGSILIPFSAAVDDHQSKNAEFLAQHDAAIILPEKTLTTKQLAHVIKELSHSRKSCLMMAKQAHQLAQNHATKNVIDVCLEAIDD